MLSRPAVWATLRALPRKFFSDNALFLAAGLAFNLLLFAIPLSLLVISALGYTLVESGRASAVVSEVLEALLPRSQRGITANLSSMVANRGLLGFVGFVGLFLVSHSLFRAVRILLNTIFEVRDPQRFLHEVRTDFLIMLATVGLVVATVVVTFVLTRIREMGETFPLLSPLITPGWQMASALLGFLFTWAIFYLLYRHSAAIRLGPVALLVGSLTGAVLLELSKAGFGWYVVLAQDSVVFSGTLGSLLFLVLWVYYASVVFVIGATIAWLYERSHA
jgi:membrane protein